MESTKNSSRKNAPWLDRGSRARQRGRIVRGMADSFRSSSAAGIPACSRHRRYVHGRRRAVAQEIVMFLREKNSACPPLLCPCFRHDADVTSVFRVSRDNQAQLSIVVDGPSRSSGVYVCVCTCVWACVCTCACSCVCLRVMWCVCVCARVHVFQGLLVLAPAAANAAFPSISEYEVGSGSVVRPKASGGQTPKKGFTTPVDSASMATGERERTHYM